MTDSQRRALLTAVAVLVAFGIGAGWQYVRAHGFWTDATELRKELTFQRLESTLAAAAVEAQRGNHEIARQLASDFFTNLQDAVEDPPEGAGDALRDILAQRDAMITALSRADAQAGSMFARLLVRYRVAMNEPVGPDPDPAVPAAPTDSTARGAG